MAHPTSPSNGRPALKATGHRLYTYSIEEESLTMSNLRRVLGALEGAGAPVDGQVRIEKSVLKGLLDITVIDHGKAMR